MRRERRHDVNIPDREPGPNEKRRQQQTCVGVSFPDSAPHKNGRRGRNAKSPKAAALSAEIVLVRGEPRNAQMRQTDVTAIIKPNKALGGRTSTTAHAVPTSKSPAAGMTAVKYGMQVQSLAGTLRDFRSH